jgi:hypothetical protein
MLPICRTTSPHAISISPYDPQVRIVQACHAWKREVGFTSSPVRHCSVQDNERTMNAARAETPQKRLGPVFGEQQV